MRTLELNIKVPDWVPRKAVVRSYWEHFKYFFNPTTCEKCAKKLLFKKPEYHLQYPNKIQGMVHAFRGPVLCRECQAEAIRAFFEADPKSVPKSVEWKSHRGNSHVKKCKCDSCGTIQPCIESAVEDWLDIRIGVRWWNGHELCENCLTSIVLHGDLSSGILYLTKDTFYVKNHRGMLIHPKRLKGSCIPGMQPSE
jgi:hypothetical protein